MVAITFLQPLIAEGLRRKDELEPKATANSGSSDDLIVEVSSSFTSEDPCDAIGRFLADGAAVLGASTSLGAGQNGITLSRGKDVGGATSSSSSPAVKIFQVARVLSKWPSEVSALYFATFFALCPASNIGTFFYSTLVT